MADTTPTAPTADQIEAMRAEVAAYDADQAAAAQAAKDAHLLPARNLAASAAYLKVQSDLAALQSEYADDASINVHTDALALIMVNLSNAAGPLPAAS